MTCARHRSPSSSVVRASDRCTEGREFDFCQELRFLSLSHACDVLIIPTVLMSMADTKFSD